MSTPRHRYAARYAFALIIALIAAAPTARADYTFTNFSVPGASRTSIAGISGSSIFGGYTDVNSVNHGFIMTNGQLTTLDAPQAGAGSNQGTGVGGISGNAIVGTYTDANNVKHGFIDSAGVYSTYDAPGAGQAAGDGTALYAVDGQNIVGAGYNGASTFGFLYNGSQFTSISDPNALAGSWATGISGTTVVGTYVGPFNSYHAFVFDGSTYTTINGPYLGSVGPVDGTVLQAMDGVKLVGTVLNTSVNGEPFAHGFIYDGSTFNIVSYPSAYGTFLTGASGNTVVGYYFPSPNSVSQSFIATSPEPTAAGVLLFGGSLLALRRRKICR